MFDKEAPREVLTSNFDEIPIQELITCIRCDTEFLIIEWGFKL